MGRPLWEIAFMLKLFVVGEYSPDPDDWGSEHFIVIANNAEEAEGLAMRRPAVELPMDSPMVLACENTGYGDD
jgi:hypothetical protein